MIKHLFVQVFRPVPWSLFSFIHLYSDCSAYILTSVVLTVLDGFSLYP